MRTKFKAIIVDDLPLAIASLKADLEDLHPEIEILDTATGVMDAAKKIKKHNPNLVFLDIHMGDGDGFDLLEIIQSESISVIFTTASEDHAIKAFQYAASDYLLKPVDPELLTKAIEKLKNKVTQPENKKNKSQTITLNTQEEIRLVNTEDIIRLESMGNYTTFYLSDKSKVLVTKTMKDFEKILSSNFIRAHQSHLVNLNHVKAYVKTEGGYLELKNGKHVPVSFRKRSSVIEALSSKKE